jgi:uncharacterized protein (TIGR02996 family)
MTHAEAFVQAIIAEPDADAPRLICADWLDEQGDPRGGFIRVQCRLASLPPDDPARADLEDEEHALLARHGAEWSAPFEGFADEWRFRRGFVEDASLSAEALLAHGEALFATGPLRRLQLRVPAGQGREVFGCPLLARVEALDLGGWMRRDNCLPTMLASPYLTRLRCLGLAFATLEWAGVQALVQAPVTAGLEELDLSGNHGLADRAARALATAAAPRLRRLSLSGTAVTWRGLHDLLGARGLPELETLEAAAGNLFQNCPDPEAAFPGLETRMVMGRLTDLDLSSSGLGVRGLKALRTRLGRPRRLALRGCELGDEGARLLAESACLVSLAELDLGHNGIRADGLRALADSPFLSGLRRLLLPGNTVRDAGVKALAASSSLTGLTVLDLRKNHIGGPGIQALAASPALGRLTSLELGENFVGVQSVRALLESPALAGLTHLGLANNHLEPESLRQLAASPSLARLKSLDLSGNEPLGLAGARALAASPHLARLTQLRLTRTGLEDAGADALAASPHLNRLQRLEVDGNPLTQAARQRLRDRFGKACGI